ncbi:hypothetical protein [Mycolicibacterium mageritense]|uniref:hypothetical protein n=1 Tax=Mycolicibacterium mageritense TaxID=53462 RepID=UPI0011D4200E|nr:hypothetical protein [Mycolicibacterium mageritense]TXI63086.1 MAG: hypothetical protein E6Q55_11100 [Mycolicibacterium mageritense]
MAAVTGQHIADFLGQGDDSSLVTLAGSHSEIVTQMARAYTRDSGFSDGVPNADIASVITTAAARLVANPEQLGTTVGTVAVRNGFNGWTLTERLVLNRYRKQAL